MLRLDRRSLDQGPVEIGGSLAPDDPLFAGLDFALAEAVRVTGTMAAAGPGRYFLQGDLLTRVRGVCRRCLAPVDSAVAVRLGMLFTDDPLADDPSAWVLDPQAATLDLSEAIREELILSVPEYVLCREDCRGLCPGCGEDLNVGTCTCRPAADARWAPLEALRRRLPDDPR